MLLPVAVHALSPCLYDAHMSISSGQAAEFTIEELARRAEMTVRNVRAYASRGLIPAPRLQGRTGYYNRVHLQRLRLIRALLDRGYTLAAVEEAVMATPASAAGHTLNLLDILAEPGEPEEPEVMTPEALADLARVQRDSTLIDSLAALGLVERLDDGKIRVLRPTVVRAGAAAVSLGLSAESVIELFPRVTRSLREVADAFVGLVSGQIVDPFIDAGMPEEQWQHVTEAVETLLPVASQVVVAVFREQLADSIEAEIGEQLKRAEF